MGIVNVTPDSFSGDGLLSTEQAVDRALNMVRSGADIIDIGAESTRPGHSTITVEEELQRLLPVLAAVRQRTDSIISVDTTKPLVLVAAVEAGADILNSIWGLTDELLEEIGRLQIPVVLMHNKEKASYAGDVLEEVLNFLSLHAGRATALGIKSEHVIVDPGIGFGKSAEHNLQILHSLERLSELGYPTLLGASRKSFIGKLTARPVESRLIGTCATTALAVAKGIDIVRVHDVAEAQDVLKVADAIVRGTRPEKWDFF
jgi:dihydropteroate synthase